MTQASLDLAEGLVQLPLLFLEILEHVVLSASNAMYTREGACYFRVAPLIIRTSGFLNRDFAIIALNDDL